MKIKKQRGQRLIGVARLLELYRAGKGRSKHKDKKANGGKVPMEYIYSESTLLLYIAIWGYYLLFLRIFDLRHRDIGSLVLYLQWYADYLADAGYSAWTIKSRVSAIKKALGVNCQIWTPRRLRKNIKRSRGHASDGYLRGKAKKHGRIVLFCLCVGLRKCKELKRVHGSDLVYKNGVAYIHVRKGKGGQPRDVKIIGSRAEVEMIVKMCQDAVKAAKQKAAESGRAVKDNDDLLFPVLPSDLDVHAMRAIYACRAYLSAERDLSTLDEVYHFARDMAGLQTDMAAMLYASEQLGHHRISVIAGHYMWPLDYVRHADFSWVLGFCK